MFAYIKQCTAFVLQTIVYNNAANRSGSRSFSAYKEHLSHCYYIRYIFALSVSFVVSSYDLYSVTFSAGICQIIYTFKRKQCLT